MVNRVGYEKMEEEEMFPHLLPGNFRSLVEVGQTKLITNFFIEKPLEKKINNLAGIFFFFFVVGVSY